MKWTLLKLLLFIAAFITVERLCHKVTHGFRLHKIHSQLVFDPNWASPPLSTMEMEHVRSVLSQPYTFLNSGGESYAFLSEDGKYVLKFFKHHHMRPRHWMDPILPSSVIETRFKRFNRFFTSCKLAFDKLRNETGLVFIHLNKTDDLKITLNIVDPIGITHRVDLDKLEFALQKRVEMAYSTFDALAEAQDLEGAKARIASLVELIALRCKAGIADHDAQIRNFGFMGTQAIEIDLGSFSPDETLKTPQAANKALFFETTKLKAWITKHYPELTPYIDQVVNDLLQINN